MYKEVVDFFTEITEEFTIFVVEKRFATERGRIFFEEYRNTESYIASHSVAESFIRRTLDYILKHVPNVAELIQEVFLDKSLDLPKIVESLYKLFSIHEHQAAGPVIIDPIIIEENYEGKVVANQINQIISLHSQSILRPRIILILKDNDFDRAKKLLATSPNGIKIKFIRNDGSEEFARVLNCGVDNINAFLDVYARQCFDACSKTETSVISNPEWAGDSLIREFGPYFLKFRSMLLYGEKKNAKKSINYVMKSMEAKANTTEINKQILLGLQCFGKLFQVFCNDFGGEDIKKAERISKELNNDILTAHVYRYASFMEDKSKDEVYNMLESAEKIFSKNKLEDHAIYCKNNFLFRYFYESNIPKELFVSNVERVEYNVPGLIGASIIFNNAGAAYIYNGDYENAIKYLEKGICKNPQKDHGVGLRTNVLIAQYLSRNSSITDIDIKNLIDDALLYIGIDELSFLTANTVTNALLICLDINRDLAHYFLNKHEIKQMYQNALKPEALGRNSLNLQLAFLQNKYKSISIADCTKTNTEGMRRRFLEAKGLNPAIYNAWL